MTTTRRYLPTRTAAGDVRLGPRTFLPPVRAVRFWIVQAGVLSVAMLHDIVLVDIPGARHSFGVADAMTSAFLLVPVIYAALNFGVRGSIATSVWATALIAPHWWLMHDLSGSHLVIEMGNLAVLYTVAIVVGQRVESEQHARHRAEAALEAARTASIRYQSLFEQQPAPVIITDAAGTISEVNTAATRLFGPIEPQSMLQDVLSVTVAEVRDAQPQRLSLRTADGGQRLFIPTAHTLDVHGPRRLVQIVLTDVTEQHRRQEEQRVFSGRLLAVQEEERRKLAQELHDDPLQNLVYLTRALDDLSEDATLPAGLQPAVRYGGELAGEAATALRKVIHGLRPPVLDDIGIASALRQLVADVRKRSTLAIALRCAGAENGLPSNLKLTVYRIVQESLNNVVRHAQACHAMVRVRFGDPLTLTISDDGRGIPHNLGSADGPPPGLGLIGMRERATLAGGTLRVSTRSPHGTIVHARLPSSPGQGNQDLEDAGCR
ncbi:MAG: ATP-binding protein [Micromonosporaceae bacterium]